MWGVADAGCPPGVFAGVRSRPAHARARASNTWASQHRPQRRVRPYPHGGRVLAHSAEGSPARRESLESGPQPPRFSLPHREKKYFLVWCSLLLLVAAGLRLYALGQNSLWVDEYRSLLTARFPLTDIPAAALSRDAFEPPVYFWLLHLVIWLFGDSEVALRFLSAIAGAITAPLAGFLFQGLGVDARAAIGGAALLALSPLHLW